MYERDRKGTIEKAYSQGWLSGFDFSVLIQDFLISPDGYVIDVDGNRQVKSRRRVREFGEVFTAEREVKAMCDLIPAEMYEIGHVFLEPCCGNGNFLAEILRRKLDNCRDAAEAEAAVLDIYAIDIQADNVAESKARMQAIVAERFPGADVSGILRRNIVCGDSLKITEKLAEGKTWEETTT